jgi:hypothetical protein
MNFKLAKNFAAPGQIMLLVFLLTGITGALIYTRQNGHQMAGSARAALPEEVSFNNHIRPILSDRCFSCHGPDENKREAGLRLDTEKDAYAVLKDTKGVHGIVPGNPQASGVFLRLIAEDPAERMPPLASNLSLTRHELDLIEKWIRQGAKYEKHWAFIPPKKHPLPSVVDKSWPVNEIDYFVLSKLEASSLEPNEKASKENLLRRVSLEVTGLPPTLADMDRFLNDVSPDAYEKLIDRLLRAPAYGERMALQWLDISRYADSYGYQDDQWRSQWPWRDWVIHAFNQNMPYSRFLLWQLAGDMLPNASSEQVLATAFGRNHKITEEQGVIDEEYRVNYVLDRTNTFSKGVLGITMECAQCHDHKFDPFSQKNYYQLFAFFNNTADKGLQIANSRESKPATFPTMTIGKRDLAGILNFINNPDTSSIHVSVMGELKEKRKTHVLLRGVYDAPGIEVLPSTPEAILPLDTIQFPRNRIGLAKWTVSKDNPLTARVFVNQIWASVFGRGIVTSAGDFGSQGDLPSHPELLDWLAADFVEHGWNVKRLVRQMVTSATYRQSSRLTKDKMEIDPENKFLSRMSRVRLPAELIRDQVLASSGLLSKTIGGPSFKPYQPEGIWEVRSSGRGNLKRYVQDHGEQLYRRGIYTFIKLTSPPPNMLVFDASNRDQCEVTRMRTNTPLQALVMMNDPIILEASRVFAGRLLNLKAGNELDRLRLAFRQILSRSPEDKEVAMLDTYYKNEKHRYRQHPKDAYAFLQVGESQRQSAPDLIQHAALMSVVHMIYNLEETITKN